MKTIFLCLITLSAAMFNLPALAGNGRKYTYHTCPSLPQASMIALTSSIGQLTTTAPINGLSYQVFMSNQQPVHLGMSVSEIKNKGGTFFKDAVESYHLQKNGFVCEYILPAPNAPLGGVTQLTLGVHGKTLCKAQFLQGISHRWQAQLGSLFVGSGIQVRYCHSSNPADCPFKCQ